MFSNDKLPVLKSRKILYVSTNENLRVILALDFKETELSMS